MDIPVDGVEVPNPKEGVDVVPVAPNGVVPTPRLNAIFLR